MKSFISEQPYVRRSPFTGRLFLIAIGTPAKGRSSPAEICAAACSAPSSSTCTKAFSAGFSSSMRSSEACASSRAETSPARTIAASSTALRNISSPSLIALRSLQGAVSCDDMGLPHEEKASAMSAVTAPEVQSGLEGVVAFATEIAEPDKEGGALRYRGVDIEDLVGKVPYEQVWGLLVDGRLKPGLPPAEPHALTVRSGDPRVDVQSALAMLAPEWGFGQLIDITDD